MSRLMHAATLAAILLTGGVVATSTVPSLAQENSAVSASATDAVRPIGVATPEAPLVFRSEPVVQPQPEAPAPQEAAPASPVAIPSRAGSLAQMVRAVEHREPETSELRCLAAGVYFESNGESLDGQLAVAHVIINRSQSGRFASSYCGVLTQRGQFSFVRGGHVPQPPRNAAWQRAVAIARIAEAGEWNNPAPGALFFHAARISPGWNRPRIARIDNHVFYR